MTINIKLSPVSSASIRETKEHGWNVAIFRHRKIVCRITKKDVSKISTRIILNYLIAPPILVPPHVAELILNVINGTRGIDYCCNILETMGFIISMKGNKS